MRVHVRPPGRQLSRIRRPRSDRSRPRGRPATRFAALRSSAVLRSSRACEWNRGIPHPSGKRCDAVLVLGGPAVTTPFLLGFLFGTWASFAARQRRDGDAVSCSHAEGFARTPLARAALPSSSSGQHRRAGKPQRPPRDERERAPRPRPRWRDSPGQHELTAQRDRRDRVPGCAVVGARRRTGRPGSGSGSPPSRGSGRPPCAVSFGRPIASWTRFGNKVA